MRLTIQEAHDLAARVMAALGHDAAGAALIADHLIDCELRGLEYGGLARAISIAERIERTGDRRHPIAILHETPVSARLDGGDHIGYIVAHRATTVAIGKAEAAGIAVVGSQRNMVHGHAFLLCGDGGGARPRERNCVECVTLGRALRSD